MGHGVVTRQHLGPLTPGGRPEAVEIVLRRYRCRACRAVLLVGPSGLLRRRWYGGGPMAVALARYARGETSAAIRIVTSPLRHVGVSARERWITLERWVDAAAVGRLFAVSRVAATSRRQVAEHVTHVLAARAGHHFGDDLLASAFAGAAVAV